MAEMATVTALIREAEDYTDTMAKDRLRAIEYYNGTMKDTPSETGRSSVVIKVVRSQIKKALPSIVRTILGGDDVVEYMPVGEGDEEGAKQATDYINSVVMTSGARASIEDAIHDALRHKNGVLRWHWENKRCVAFSRHTGLADDAFSELVADDSVTVLEHTERQEEVQLDPTQPPQMMAVHDCRIKRIDTESSISINAVPLERFLIHPDAVCIDDSPIVGEKTEISRSELISMGYDRKMVDGLPDENDDETEADARLASLAASDGAQDKANGKVSYYDLYVRADLDNDGIAELRHMVFAGGTGQDNVLVNEECDDVQFCTVRGMREPHQWEGVAMSDDLEDIQRVSTVLVRETLDNIYWQNKPQPIIQDGAIIDEEAIYNPEFGKPIRLRAGVAVSEAYSIQQIPFVAGHSFEMLAYFDNEATNRTGITDAASGLAPDALQNMTAKASAMVEQAGIGQIELIVRTMARDLVPFFQGVLRCIIRHQDVAKTVRMRGKWVPVDPRDWNAAMDCSVNVGLGAGTRERDMMMMQQVMSIQNQIVAAFGPDNLFVKPEHLSNALKRMVESAGLKTPSMYFNDPAKEEIEQTMAALAQQPSPEDTKLQGVMQIEQAKAQAALQSDQAKAQVTMQTEQTKAQANVEKEKAQMLADLQVASADRDAQKQLKQMEIDWDREKFNAELAARLAESGLRVGPDGVPVNPTADAATSMMQQTQQMLAMMSASMAGANAPKRVIRDAAGEIIGLETASRVN